MSENGKSITAWISIALILFGMISGAIAFTVTTNNKANNNERSIVEQEHKNVNQDERIRYLELQTKDIDEMKIDIKELKEQNTEILVSLGRIEEKLEKER